MTLPLCYVVSNFPKMPVKQYRQAENGRKIHDSSALYCAFIPYSTTSYNASLDSISKTNENLLALIVRRCLNPGSTVYIKRAYENFS